MHECLEASVASRGGKDGGWKKDRMVSFAMAGLDAGGVSERRQSYVKSLK